VLSIILYASQNKACTTTTLFSLKAASVDSRLLQTSDNEEGVRPPSQRGRQGEADHREHLQCPGRLAGRVTRGPQTQV